MLDTSCPPVKLLFTVYIVRPNIAYSHVLAYESRSKPRPSGRALTLQHPSIRGLVSSLEWCLDWSNALRLGS